MSEEKRLFVLRRTEELVPGSKRQKTFIPHIYCSQCHDQYWYVTHQCSVSHLLEEVGVSNILTEPVTVSRVALRFQEANLLSLSRIYEKENYSVFT